MLLNRAKDESYGQAGIYVSFAPSLEDPRLWTVPQPVMSGGGRWYPQVMGLTTGRGTDKLAGATARLFLGGRSRLGHQFLPITHQPSWRFRRFPVTEKAELR